MHLHLAALLILIIASASASNSASAEQVTVAFSTRVTRVVRDGVPAAFVQVGDAMQVAYTFETTTPDGNPEDPAFGSYDGVVAMSVVIPARSLGFSFGFDPFRGAVVTDDAASSGVVSDGVELHSENPVTVSPVAGEPPTVMSITFVDERPAGEPVPTMLSGDAMPFEPFPFERGAVDFGFDGAGVALSIHFVPDGTPATLCPPAVVAERISTEPYPGTATETGEPQGLEIVDGTLVIADDDEAGVWQFDPDLGAPGFTSTNPYPGEDGVAAEPRGVASDGSRLWISSGSFVDEVVLGSLEFVARLDLSAAGIENVEGLAAASDGRLWAAERRSDSPRSCVRQIDPDDGTVLATHCYDGRDLLPERGLRSALRGLAWDGKQLWAADDDAVFAIAPESGAVLGCLDTNPAGDEPRGLAFAEGQLWFAEFTSFGDEWVGRIDLAASDVDADGVAHTADVCPFDPDPAQGDADGDRVGDACDVCRATPNPEQRDSDRDGVGNACDGDLDQDGLINLIDLGLFRSRFLTSDPHADFDGDGVVNLIDLRIFRELFLKPLGPGATAP